MTTRAPRSEREAWEDVAEAANQARINVTDWTPARMRSTMENIMALAQAMKKQVDSGVHTNPVTRDLRPNPTLAIWGNPPGSVRVSFHRKMSGNVFAIEYNHAKDHKDYRHDFDPGADMVAAVTGDGQRVILIMARDGRELWEDF